MHRSCRHPPRGNARVLLLLVLAALAAAAFLRPSATPPAQAADEPEIPMSAQEERDAEEEGRWYTLREEDIDGGRRYLVTNLLAGPLAVSIDWTERDNMRADPALPLRRVIPALAETAVLDITHADRTRPARYSVSIHALPGSPRARHSLAARYRVPFEPGTGWRVDQGFQGRYSHQHRQSRYALDFGVPVGTPVLAAREGVVMQVQDDYRGNGQDLEGFAHRANFVRILHDDGTMAMYAHLEYYGVGVKPGQRVAVGTLLGLSGNTGYSTGPHLHFAVLANDGTDEVSIPFDMDDVVEDIAGD
jgi:murein DD-endopeptidase MepM/ murein hydrolase activator NlpD